VSGPLGEPSPAPVEGLTLGVAVIWRVADRVGRPVALTEDGWLHIVERHDDLAGREDDVRAAVERPDLVRRDAVYVRRENHYRRFRPEDPWLKVVVNYRPRPEPTGWAGEVVTAYETTQLPPKEEPLWP